MLTFETGVRLQDISDSSLCAQIITHNKVNHVEISNISYSKLTKVISVISSLLGSGVEFSYEFSPEEIIGLFRQKVKIILPTTGPKYFLIPLRTLTLLDVLGVSSFDFFDYLLDSTSNRFICIEITIGKKDTSGISNAISSLQNIKEAHPSSLIIYSLNLDSLSYVSDLNKYATELRMFIGIIQAQIDSKYLKINNQDDSFVALLDTLYWLPYRQQPLVFTNPLSEVGSVFRRFYSIIEQRGYTYF